MFVRMIEYRPLEERTPDLQYQNLLKLILEQGIRSSSQQGVDTISLVGAPPMRYRLSNGVPLITERNMAPVFKNGKPTVWMQAVAEITAFINGIRTQKGLEEFGCYWWEPWVTEEKTKKRGLHIGDLGPGSYGAAFHDFPTSEGEDFNQFAVVLQQMKENQHLKTHFISPWVPQYTARVAGRTQKVVVCPCHGWLHFRIFDNKLIVHMFQRSGDVPVGVPSNMIQYSALTLMVAQVLGLEAYEYVHTISDAHIFVDQVESVEKMLAREPRPFPKLLLNSKSKDLFSFRSTDFSLEEYDPYPGIARIPVAI